MVISSVCLRIHLSNKILLYPFLQPKTSICRLSLIAPLSNATLGITWKVGEGRIGPNVDFASGPYLILAIIH